MTVSPSEIAPYLVGQLSERSIDSVRTRLRALENRCRELNLTLEDVDAALLSDLLYVWRNEWSHQYMRGICWALDWWCEVNQFYPIGCDPAVRAALKVLRRHDEHVPIQMDAYDDELPAVLEAIGRIVGPANRICEARAIAAVYVSSALRLPLREVTDLPMTGIVLSPGEGGSTVNLEHGNRNAVIHKVPRIVETSLAALLDPGLPSRPWLFAIAMNSHSNVVAMKPHPSHIAGRLIKQAATASRRARLQLDLEAPLKASQANQLIRSLSIATAMRARDRAYVLLQVDWGLRGCEVEKVTIRDVYPGRARGFRMLVHTKGGTEHVVYIGHGHGCRETCPACALRLWLKLRPQVEGALFCTLPAADPAPHWTKSAMSGRLRRVADIVGSGKRWGRHSGRVDFHNRISAMTDPYVGAHLARIADKDAGMTYLRERHPFKDQPQLPL